LPLKSNCLVVSTLESEGKVLGVDVRTAAEPKNLKLPTPQVEVAINRVDGKTFEATFESPVYAKAVKLDVGDVQVWFSDNFFDLLPHQKKTVAIHVEAPLGAEKLEELLKWQSYPYV
jgi:hypothetical protein